MCFLSAINPTGDSTQAGACSNMGARASGVTQGDVSAEVSAYENVMTSSEENMEQTSSSLTDRGNYKYVDKGDNIILHSSSMDEDSGHHDPVLHTGQQYPGQVTEVTSQYKGCTSEQAADDDDVFLSPKDVLFVSRSVQAIDPELTSQGHYITQLSSQGQHSPQTTSQGLQSPQMTSQGQHNALLTSVGHFNQHLSSQGHDTKGQNLTLVRPEGGAAHEDGYKIILPKDDSYRVSITCVKLSSQERQAVLEAPWAADTTTPWGCQAETRKMFYFSYIFSSFSSHFL